MRSTVGRERRAAGAVPRLLACACLLSFAGGCASAGRPAAEVWPPPAQGRPRVGLALGGGGARGFAQIGVIRVLEQEKVPIDLVVGTSVGSLIGAMYADTGNGLDLEFAAVSVDNEDIFDFKALSIFSGGFVKGERLERFLATHLKATEIERLRIPFAAVAVDLRTGRRAVFDRGPIARAVHASAAIPGVFVPVQIEGRTFVDGGLTDPVPADVARRMGAQVVIAVAIPANVPPRTPDNPIEIAFHAVTIMSAEIGRLRAGEADVVISPDAGDVAYDDFSQKKRLMEAGAAAARAALPAIRAAILAKTNPEGGTR